MVCFDTIYQINKNLQPFAPIVGFNHCQETIIFGVVLSYDAIVESFEWLFEIFLKVMYRKKLIIVFIDQDTTMAEAIKKVFPKSYHCLFL